MKVGFPARLVGVILVAAGAIVARTEPDFSRDIEPLFRTRCYSCHGEKVQMRKFRLDRRSDALRGGESGVPAIVPGNSAQSLLVRYVAGGDPAVVMPPAGPRLTAEQIELFSMCRYLISIHGAGLTNMIYRHRNPMTILEIIQPSAYIPFHYITLAHQYNYSYDIILGEKGNLHNQGGFRVNPAHFSINLEAMMKVQ